MTSAVREPTMTDDAVSGRLPGGFNPDRGSFAAYFCSNGYCSAANTNVSGMKPNALNATQVSVDWVRHTTSLSTASAKKNSAQRMVSLRQPCSLR